MNYKILEDVYIGSNGIVFDGNKNILNLHPFYQDHINKESKSFASYKIIILPLKEYVDLTHFYGHWPFAHRYDALSRVRHIESIITDDSHFLIGIETEGFTKGRFNEECKLFGVRNKIYFPTGNVLFKVERLIYPCWVYNISTGNESPVQFTEESFCYCKSKYQEYFKGSGNKYKLFLTRFNMSRGIINFEDVHNFFKNYGFIIVDGSEDLKTTIEYFYNAQVIVGIHGGLFSNLIFCSEVERIVEIFSREYYNGCFFGWKGLLNIKKEYNILTFESTNGNIFLKQNDLMDLIKL